MEADFAPVISDMSKELKNFTKESNATLEKLDQKAQKQALVCWRSSRGSSPRWSGASAR